ncbi:MAG: transcription-repair coupling factor, partial [Bacilli bacterium]|nr:transcription-repair coupling factor [Bacilli bacterium]
YHGGELLYVPLSQFQLVRKYMGKEGASPRLSRLHSKDWENTKKKIKEKVNDLANRLMNLYLERNKAIGYSFQKDDEFQKEFEESFEYELTRDQLSALNDIKKDMESPHPMDRLLCGDVGFGKTEVAFRAAFKAINSGKQVAILCPTTLLARQHYELALQRFSGFDIKIAAFSRLISEKEQKKFINEVKEGKAHLVIGTHRLLSKDIQFKDLGLLIIDEEQRFGVEQKERIKELKTNIDVLTLSATPIPRTLQISLLGVRSMSIINTPPKDRMPIQTYVTPFDMDVVKELIERELGRNGQVFFLHNNVSTLYLRAAKLQKMLPDVSIGVAHGQMNRDDIEDVMIKFYNGEVKVLVCTSIVENGIDIPNANMIIVEDSDHYGLSQLYQIKGRVGRSDRIAYAYLMYSPFKVLTEKAQKRLKALQEFTELGSGYKIAQRDLMIRGAGDILGPEQAGFIDSIGLDMYIKLLNEAVKEKMTGVSEEQVEANPSLSLDAYIPNNYAGDSDKIELYQEILMAPSIEDLATLKIKIQDIYGKIPDEVERLFAKRTVDLLVRDGKVEELKEVLNNIEIILGNDFINIKGIGNILFETLIPYLNFIKVNYSQNKFKIIMKKRKFWIEDLQDILRSLVNIQKQNVVKEVV